ncbi:phytanoyl-CoA dioxygenase family protein [Variovorax sp. RA8]|uniref:phytanoyl-CoA dioxygenase family protein n=1 Tax=Variovorax sp. (strain JCM 16519 / RA8) TaxID=662548 RepID=UPI0013165BA5|nr:phytanoyl-CoA dioxygenase family protein [Variovorax sp. RA8]VTU21298.1 chlorinating enzymes [Variovorax sp. RA8]
MDMSIRIPLAAEQVSFYRSSGYVAPVRVLPEDEAAGYRRHLEAFEAAHGGPIPGKYRHKPHLLFPWLADLVRHPRILDAVESLLGPDLLVWSSVFFIKEPHDPAYVSWHQDSTYWELSEPEVVTAWVALSPSHHENGCLRVVPGTQMLDQVEHVDMQDENNLLTRGQEIAVKVDEAAAVELPLQPGEMSLHHIRLFHNSQPNQSDERRIGFAIRYIPTRVRQNTEYRGTATLVRGVDRYGHFDSEPRPLAELAPEALQFHAEMNKRRSALLFSGLKAP